jgi:5-methylcytosine-specific restriction protein A
MSLADLTPESVHQALAEFDRLGRDSFLSTYSFGKARGYLLIHNGHAYDSKAIAGVAHQYLPGRDALSADAFSGGADAAAGRLRELGFDIRGPTNSLQGRRPSNPVESTIVSGISTTSMVANAKAVFRHQKQHH